jgi:transcriptional regulator with XRE-family HTH domain
MMYNGIRKEEAMDQTKIGKFIAMQRKEKNYTQKQLADILGISDKTVSKWECGKGFPEVSLLLPLCDELSISVNELLSGERVSDDNYQKKAEENMVKLVKEAQESKKKILLSVMVVVHMLIAVISLGIVASVLEMKVWQRAVLIGISILIVILGISIACILDRDAGAYECPECHERFVPDMRTYVMSAHTVTRRRMKCPKCGKTRYCKRVLTK